MNENNKDRIRIKDIAQQAGVSVGTVDRVIHGRPGVSESSRLKVEEILKSMNYQPNMYASALASNKKYKLACLIPLHTEEDYWIDVEAGMRHAVKTYKDFNVSLEIFYYNQYERGAFGNAGKKLTEVMPDGVIIAPSSADETRATISELEERNIPYIFVDSTLEVFNPLSFFGQNAHSSGYFAARIMSMMTPAGGSVVIFRLILEGRLGSNQQQTREEGFREYLSRHRPDIKLHELDFIVNHPEENEKRIDCFFSEHPDTVCGITFNSKAYIIGEYMQKKKRNDFKMMGYDLVRRNVKCLKEGYIDFLIAQQPTEQGICCIEALFKHLILKKDVKVENYMPITLISEENIDFYLDTHLRTNNI